VTFTAFDLVRLLAEVDRVSASKVNPEQKAAVLTELLNAVPAPVFCAASPATRGYVIKTIEGAIDGCTQKTKGQGTAPEGERASTSQGTKEELLRDTDGNTGGSSVTPRVVKKTTQKRRTTKGGA
jgi:hypothetical protein